MPSEGEICPPSRGPARLLLLKHLLGENPPWRADRARSKPRELIKKILAAGAALAQVSIGRNGPGEEKAKNVDAPRPDPLPGALTPAPQPCGENGAPALSLLPGASQPLPGSPLSRRKRGPVFPPRPRLRPLAATVALSTAASPCCSLSFSPSFPARPLLFAHSGPRSGFLTPSRLHTPTSHSCFLGLNTSGLHSRPDLGKFLPRVGPVCPPPSSCGPVLGSRALPAGAYKGSTAAAVGWGCGPPVWLQ